MIRYENVNSSNHLIDGLNKKNCLFTIMINAKCDSESALITKFRKSNFKGSSQEGIKTISTVPYTLWFSIIIYLCFHVFFLIYQIINCKGFSFVYQIM